MGEDLEYKGGTTEKNGSVGGRGGEGVRSEKSPHGETNPGKVNRCEVVCGRLLSS